MGNALATDWDQLKLPERTGLGVIGCGGFAQFALDFFKKVPGVELVAQAGTFKAQAQQCEKLFGLEDVEEPEKLVERDDVDLIYIATPPFLHYEQAMLALKHDKHVLTEKPLAVTREQGRELVKTAKERKRLLVTNLMQRYNPVYEQVLTILQDGLLGEPLHAFFENYATDFKLDKDHWFWQRDKSGGIFVEHGVHFFDLFDGWLEGVAGEPQLINAHTCTRPGSGVEDQVQCVVRYGQLVEVNFYHGFHQPKQLDRQLWGIVCERGGIELKEWVPTRTNIEAVVTQDTLDQLKQLFGDDVEVEVLADNLADDPLPARFKDHGATHHVKLHAGKGVDKMERYGLLLTRMLTDQLAYLADPSHQRRITEDNALRSLERAVDATELADARSD